MASIGSPDSPLSSVPSEEEIDEDLQHSLDETISAACSPSVSTPMAVTMPPSKRRRTGASSYDQTTPTSITPIDTVAMRPGLPSPSHESISSDSSGEVPNSPSFAHLAPTHPLSSAYAASQANPDDPEAGDVAQVSRCLWTDCSEPDQGNMDRLVDHIHSEHVGQRQKKYSCEWEGCTRKSMLHASGYALKAHMRSHTREKPFYCQLPECDRCFTRSDALAKHMRTVHETEALRPSDPVPRGHNEASVTTANGESRPGGNSNGGGSGTGGSLKRIKLIVNNGPASGSGGGGGGEKDRSKSNIGDLPPLPPNRMSDKYGEMSPVELDALPFTLPVQRNYYPSDVADALEDRELLLPPSQLYRLLRRQIHWAEEESAYLTQQQEILETQIDFSEENDEYAHLTSYQDHRRNNNSIDKIEAEEKAFQKTPGKPPVADNSSSTSLLDKSFARIRRRGWQFTEAVIEAIQERIAPEIESMVENRNKEREEQQLLALKRQQEERSREEERERQRVQKRREQQQQQNQQASRREPELEPETEPEKSAFGSKAGLLSGPVLEPEAELRQQQDTQQEEPRMQDRDQNRDESLQSSTIKTNAKKKPGQFDDQADLDRRAAAEVAAATTVAKNCVSSFTGNKIEGGNDIRTGRVDDVQDVEMEVREL